jgi:hypothetical protein
VTNRVEVTGKIYFDRAQEELGRLRIPEALRLFRMAEQAHFDPDVCAARRWMCHMLDGNFELAWRESDAISHRGQPDTNRFWDGQSLTGRSILMRCLHGLGDTIQFSRYAPLIRKQAKRLVIEAQPKLKPLLQQSGIADCVITWGDPEPHWDQQIEIIEIPRIFRTTIESIPNVVPYLDLPTVPLISPYDGTRDLRIGLAWASSSYNSARSITLDRMAGILSVPGVAFFSLQGGEERQQLSSYPRQIVDLEEESRSVLATARAMKSFDLVISVDTMVAHLAGAMGRPVWTLLPYECDWRWMLGREDSPWYPTMRLFRQPRPEDWGSVVERVQTELEALVGINRSEDFPSVLQPGALVPEG